MRSLSQRVAGMHCIVLTQKILCYFYRQYPQILTILSVCSCLLVCQALDDSTHVLPSSDPTAHLLPNKIKDFTAFINLVEFCRWWTHSMTQYSPSCAGYTSLTLFILPFTSNLRERGGQENFCGEANSFMNVWPLGRDPSPNMDRIAIHVYNRAHQENNDI